MAAVHKNECALVVTWHVPPMRKEEQLIAAQVQWYSTAVRRYKTMHIGHGRQVATAVPTGQ